MIKVRNIETGCEYTVAIDGLNGMFHIIDEYGEIVDVGLEGDIENGTYHGLEGDYISE